MEVIWSQGALEDITSIFDFIARDSQVYAERTFDRIYEAASRLADFPDIGRQIPEFSDPQLREVIVNPYRLMYARATGTVRIVTILHSIQGCAPSTSIRLSESVEQPIAKLPRRNGAQRRGYPTISTRP